MTNAETATLARQIETNSWLKTYWYATAAACGDPNELAAALQDFFGVLPKDTGNLGAAQESLLVAALARVDWHKIAGDIWHEVQAEIASYPEEPEYFGGGREPH